MSNWSCSDIYLLLFLRCNSRILQEPLPKAKKSSGRRPCMLMALKHLSLFHFTMATNPWRGKPSKLQQKASSRHKIYRPWTTGRKALHYEHWLNRKERSPIGMTYAFWSQLHTIPDHLSSVRSALPAIQILYCSLNGLVLVGVAEVFYLLCCLCFLHLSHSPVQTLLPGMPLAQPSITRSARDMGFHDWTFLPSSDSSSETNKQNKHPQGEKKLFQLTWQPTEAELGEAGW